MSTVLSHSLSSVLAPSSNGKVELLGAFGNDFSIVNAARVSYDSESKGELQDKKLIKYLMDNEHTTPFEMVQFKFRVYCPIAIARQLMRQRTGKYNELSRRYTSENIEFMTPRYRLQSSKNKQSSTDEYLDNDEVYQQYEILMKRNSEFYEYLISLGVSREQARLHLPLSLMTKYIYSIDAHNLLRLIRLRISPEAQFEVREYARAFLDLIQPHIPWTVEFFKEKYGIF